MLTSKQRAKLKSLANQIDPVFQIGKGNLSDNQISELAAVLKKRELIKVSVLKGCDYTADELIAVLADELKAEPVAAIGNKMILYRHSDDKTVKHIEL